MIESEIDLHTNLSYVMAWAALSAHPKLEVKTSLQSFSKIFQTAKNAIPYMSKTAGTVDNEDRKLVEKWNKMNEAGAFDIKKD